MITRLHKIFALILILFLFMGPANAQEAEFFQFEVDLKGDCPFSGKRHVKLDASSKIDNDKRVTSFYNSDVFKERIATAIIKSYSEYSKYWDIYKDDFDEFVKLMNLWVEYKFQVLPDFVLLKYTCKNPRISYTSKENRQRVYIAYIESADTIFVLNNLSNISLVESYNKLFDCYSSLKNMTQICRAKILVSMMYEYYTIAFLDSPEDIPLAICQLAVPYEKDSPILGEYKLYLYFDHYEPKDKLNSIYNILQSSKRYNGGLFARVDSIRNATDIFDDAGMFEGQDRDIVKPVAYNPAFDGGDMVKWQAELSKSGNLLSINQVTEPVYLFMLYIMSEDSLRALLQEAK